MHHTLTLHIIYATKLKVECNGPNFISSHNLVFDLKVGRDILLSWTISLCCISPEILASFPGQYIYVISADILGLFHRPAESTALPVIFRAACSPTTKDANNNSPVNYFLSSEYFAYRLKFLTIDVYVAYLEKIWKTWQANILKLVFFLTPSIYGVLYTYDILSRQDSCICCLKSQLWTYVVRLNLWIFWRIIFHEFVGGSPAWPGAVCAAQAAVAGKRNLSWKLWEIHVANAKAFTQS